MDCTGEGLNPDRASQAVSQPAATSITSAPIAPEQGESRSCVTSCSRARPQSPINDCREQSTQPIPSSNPGNKRNDHAEGGASGKDSARRFSVEIQGEGSARRFSERIPESDPTIESNDQIERPDASTRCSDSIQRSNPAIRLIHQLERSAPNQPQPDQRQPSTHPSRATSSDQARQRAPPRTKPEPRDHRPRRKQPAAGSAPTALHP